MYSYLSSYWWILYAHTKIYGTNCAQTVMDRAGGLGIPHTPYSVLSTYCIVVATLVVDRACLGGRDL